MIMDPLPSDVSGLRARHNLTQEEFGQLAHASRRTVQNWEAEKETRDHRQIPLAAWELLNLKLGEHTLDRSSSRKAKARKARVKREAVAPASPAAPVKQAKAPPEEPLAERIERLRREAKAKAKAAGKR